MMKVLTDEWCWWLLDGLRGSLLIVVVVRGVRGVVVTSTTLVTWPGGTVTGAASTLGSRSSTF